MAGPLRPRWVMSIFSRNAGVRLALGVCGVAVGDDFGGDAGEVAPVGLVLRVEDERDEAGAGGDDGDGRTAGEVVAEGGRAHLGDGEAAGGDDEGVRQ